jgi:AraC family transcriptional regulator
MRRPPHLTDGFRVRLLSDEPGFVEIPPLATAIVSVHVGPPAQMSCRHGSKRHFGVVLHGDVEIIPWGMPGSWELKQRDTALVMSLAPGLLRAVAKESGLEGQRLELVSRFHTRDVQIEHIAWAMKGEMESGYPSGRLYLDSLAVALAVHMVRRHSSMYVQANGRSARMPPAKLKQLLLFIDDHLTRDLSLNEVAQIAGLSVSHCSTLFRAAVGQSIHQYVLRRKVERAAWLLRESPMPISQVALETGFAHPSHLALHMRRILGTTPKKLRADLD